MRVRRLTEPADAKTAYPCTTPFLFWSDALPLSRAWFAENLGHHVEGLHVEDDTGEVVGHLYWAPSERALTPFRIEERVAYIYCEWVARPRRGKGCMHLLFEAFGDGLREDGYKGALVLGTDIEDSMHASHFLARGFRTLRKAPGGTLLYLPVTQKRVRVEVLQPRIPPPEGSPVEILVIGSRLCPVAASVVLSVRKAARKLTGKVTVTELPDGKEALARYGVADGVFVNGRPAFLGPATFDQVREAIEREIARVAVRLPTSRAQRRVDPPTGRR